MKLQNERQISEIDNINDALKELQALSDEKACIGKLYHQVMIARFNIGHMNR